MKEDLIKLANEKGYSAKYTTTSDKFYYLWMCELHKWLRDNHNIYIEITSKEEMYTGSGSEHGYSLEKYNSVIKIHESPYIFTYGIEFINYEQALEKGLYEALKLIK